MMPRSTRKTVRTLILVLIALAVVLYLARVLLLFTFATEGDTPPASSIPLPTGAEIVAETRDCASGGCWITVEVQPPAGQSPEQLAEEIGATPRRKLAGNLMDPRSTWLWAEPNGAMLRIRADYYSGQWVP